MDRLTASIVKIVLVSSIVSILPVSAQDFTDVPSGNAYSEAIASLREQGVVKGYDDGSFRPNATINRAEFLKIILEARMRQQILAEGSATEVAHYPGADCFSDVKRDWFAGYVCQAKDEGIVNGYPDGSFKPAQNINFVEAAKILSLAYKQPIENFSPDWYEPYARALESAEAIPTSIPSLEHALTRGEMAEMMWRLSNNVTTKESKAYLNVKYPEVKMDMATTAPVKPESCADLAAVTQEASRSSNVYYLRGAIDDVAGAPMANEAKSGNAESALPTTGGGGDYSQTNVQVAGVDEGDTVKNDGNLIVALRGNILRIVDATPASNLQELAAISFEQEQFSAQSLYLDGTTLAVVGSAWNGGGYGIMEKRMATSIWPGPWYNRPQAMVKMYDLSNPAKPVLTRTVKLEGSVSSSRRIDDSLYLVVNSSPRWYGQPIPLTKATDADVMPLIEDSAVGTDQKPVTGCANVTVLPRIPNPEYLVVATIPLDDADGTIHSSVILGRSDQLYVSLQNLYAAATEWNYDWSGTNNQSYQATNFYRFALTEEGTEFASQGKVPGRLLNQFSMDEKGDTFRVATTKDESWISENNTIKSSNQLYVLNKDLAVVGSVEGIAPGEQIYSVRFLGDRAYIVTFKKTDPLFVIDLNDARKPTILGQLKIPGYSDYLHPFADGYLLGFGKEATEDAKGGDFAWYQGMKVALFDVRDPANPKELWTQEFGDRGTQSPLLYDHHALLFDASRNLLAFPISIAKLSDEQKKSTDQWQWGQTLFQGAELCSVSKSGLGPCTQETHYTADDLAKAGNGLWGKDVDRIVRIGDVLYTLSDVGVHAVSGSNWKTLEDTLTFGKSTVSGDSCPVEGDGTRYVSKDPDTCATIRFTCDEGQEAFSGTCGCGCVAR